MNMLQVLIQSIYDFIIIIIIIARNFYFIYIICIIISFCCVVVESFETEATIESRAEQPPADDEVPTKNGKWAWHTTIYIYISTVKLVDMNLSA